MSGSSAGKRYDKEEQKDKKCLDSVLVFEWTNKKLMGLQKEKRQDLTKEVGDRKEDESDTQNCTARKLWVAGGNDR